jgi:6-pyruvoyltetrahydropterin/6-carboxytetrahydropterin synthase
VRPVYLTRAYHFSAAHRLYHPNRDDAWNRTIFGKCSNEDGHGHNYELEVTIRGVPDPESGRVIDPAVLDSIVAEEVIEPFDHHHLNVALDSSTTTPPTSEVLAVAIWDRLERRLRDRWQGGPTLFKLEVDETPRNSFEYYGSGDP